MLDARVKERLTGAIVLVALLVLLVPELLTGPGRSAPAAAVTKSAEGEGAQMRSYTINLADGAAKAAAPGPSSAAPIAPLPAPAPSGDAPASAEGSAQPEGSAAPNEAAAADAKASTPGPSPESSSSAASSDSTVPKPLPAPAKEPAKRPAAAEAPEPSAPPRTPSTKVASADPAPARPVATGTGFAVQVGSFASRENAERLARELKGKGFAATVSPGSGKKRLWRVRVGPEPDRAAAAALGARLRAQGQSGAVVPYP